jgi:hypothetical protein
MGEVNTIGLDIAKSVFQVHGVDDAGAVVIHRSIGRSKVLEFFLLPFRRAWWGLKLVHRRITGAADCSRSVTRCGF